MRFWEWMSENFPESMFAVIIVGTIVAAMGAGIGKWILTMRGCP